MGELEVIRLGAVDGYTMTSAFVVLASSVSDGKRGDTLVVCHSEKPFANVGFHQEVMQEIDVDYCSKNSIPIVRRLIGGGAIADGPWEEDYFFITSLDSPATSGTIGDYYRRMLEPVSEVLSEFGLKASRQGLNDLAVNGRKISANGAVDIEGARVLTGDILLDLDIDIMANILKVPDAKFRDKMAASMKEHLTSMRRELGREIEREKVTAALIRAFGRKYSGIKETSLSDYEKSKLKDLIAEHSKPEWIYSRDSERSELMSGRRVVKIREEMFLCQADYKAQKLIRVTMLVDGGKIANIIISGDFFTVPVNWSIANMENALAGTKLNKNAIIERIKNVLSVDHVTVLGASPEDFSDAILEAAKHPAIKRGMDT
jgi:lipoate-protein ligase A